MWLCRGSRQRLSRTDSVPALHFVSFFCFFWPLLAFCFPKGKQQVQGHMTGGLSLVGKEGTEIVKAPPQKDTHSAAISTLQLSPDLLNSSRRSNYPYWLKTIAADRAGLSEFILIPSELYQKPKGRNVCWSLSLSVLSSVVSRYHLTILCLCIFRHRNVTEINERIDDYKIKVQVPQIKMTFWQNLFCLSNYNVHLSVTVYKSLSFQKCQNVICLWSKGRTCVTLSSCRASPDKTKSEPWLLVWKPRASYPESSRV